MAVIKLPILLQVKDHCHCSVFNSITVGLNGIKNTHFVLISELCLPFSPFIKRDFSTIIWKKTLETNPAFFCALAARKWNAFGKEETRSNRPNLRWILSCNWQVLSHFQLPPVISFAYANKRNINTDKKLDIRMFGSMPCIFVCRKT